MQVDGIGEFAVNLAEDMQLAHIRSQLSGRFLVLARIGERGRQIGSQQFGGLDLLLRNRLLCEGIGNQQSAYQAVVYTEGAGKKMGRPEELDEQINDGKGG
jgi:hypothetical protein